MDKNVIYENGQLPIIRANVTIGAICQNAIAECISRQSNPDDISAQLILDRWISIQKELNQIKSFLDTL